MRHYWLVATAVALVPGVAGAQAIYPIDRATILSGSKFDFKVEFPEVVKEADVKVLVNGEDHASVFGKKAEFTEKEKDANASAIRLNDVVIAKPGTYKIEASVAGQPAKSVTWEVYGTADKPVAKNVIFLIGDGMSVAHRTAARIMSRGNTQGKANAKLNMDYLPNLAFIGTSSTDSIAADSANTASAYFTGHKSAVNALGVYDSRAKNSLEHPKQETLGQALRRAAPNKKLGIVTTAEVEDATPAALVANTRKRADKDKIVGMHFAVLPDVLLGGGSAYFLPQGTPGSKRKDDIDYIAKFRDEGYSIATDRDSLIKSAAETNSGKVLGLFHTGNMDVLLDRQFLKRGTVDKFPNQPGLVDMTKAALDVLSKNEDGFVLMVEGASIDKMSHPLDWDRAAVETIEFDNAVGVAREFAEKHPDTLVIVTADHTHGVGVVGTIDDNKPGDDMREKVGTYQDAGFPNYEDKDGDTYPDDINVSKRLAIFSNNFPDYYETWRPKLDGPFVPAIKNEKDEYIANEQYRNVPGAVLRIGNIPRSGDTGVHAVDDVVLQSQGPGSEKLKGYMENSDVYRVVVDALALGAKQ
ncbi:alkaline phosphatase [Pseudochelatococcus lubricantis]|uniref:Alkaline phosphatase n=1 Tax=Pseudochelatococcus lubricantis TaxID=1538102 RepID=A0ABX0UVA7_9HYPH|nr:alkaline phosphatase [Pseudochelatococcus lubricantis]NIJ56697.1 alkaline phosphatase [Pseudochelatococcus lubricantis]